MRIKTREISMLRFTTVVCLLFGLLGVVASQLASSRSLLLDGLYSLIQSLFILGSGQVVTLLFKRDNDKFPFGFAAFEPFFLVLRSITLLVMVLAIGSSAFLSLFTGGYEISVNITLPISALSLVVCAAVYTILKREANRVKSPVLRAESKAWLLDTLLSLASLSAMLIAYIASRFSLTLLMRYIDPVLTLGFLVCMIPLLGKDLVQYSKELLGAAPASSTQAALERIAYKFVRKYDFLKAEVFASKQGRSLNILMYIYLKEERSVLQLDSIRLEILKALYSYSNWCEADIIFTLDDRWVDYTALPSLQQA
jgi:predicted Co/Zn/Cd cation transporter (cation efflux family)